MALTLPVSFVSRVPGKVDSTQLIDIEITNMQARDALWWDRRMGPHNLRIAHRADRFWPWMGLLPMCHLTQLAQRRGCRPLVIWGQADNGQFVRVAMSIAIERYPYLDINDGGDSYFIWFMCAADKNVLVRHFGFSNPPAVGEVLLDNAMVLSANDQLEGRIGLHSDPAGGNWLRNWYAGKGLTEVPKNQAFPRGVRRANKGGYFVASPRTAQKLIRSLDPQR